MEGTEESVDFDFFETPRVGDNVEPESVRKESPDYKQQKNTDTSTEKSTNERARSPSPKDRSGRSSSPNYSSDSFSVSEDESESRSRPVDKNSRVDFRHSSKSSLSSLSSDSRSRSASRDRSVSSRSRSSSRSRDADKKRRTSTDTSDSENSDNKYSLKSLPKKTGQRHRKERDSSSAYSDGDDCRSDSSVSKQKSQQAWGKETLDEPSKQRPPMRCKSAKIRIPQDTDKPKALKKQLPSSSQQRRPRSDSDTFSDSDMTDVSPMDSPRATDQLEASNISASGDQASVKQQYKAMPLDDSKYKDESEEDEDRVQKGSIDLEILMKAVGELEKQKRVEANTRRVMFAPMSLMQCEKANYTFDKDQTRSIDKENERLMKEIVRRVHSTENKGQFRLRNTGTVKATPSAINREKEMKRIESENLSFLKRLQKVKPTKTISRDNQLRTYEGTKLHGIPIAALHQNPRAGARSRSDVYSRPFSGRSRSTTSLNSTFSTTSSVLSTPSRRSSRPSSAVKRADTRPDWSDRW